MHAYVCCGHVIPTLHFEGYAFAIQEQGIAAQYIVS